MVLFYLLNIRAGRAVTHPLCQAGGVAATAIVVELCRVAGSAAGQAELSNGLVLPADELTLLPTDEQWAPVAGFPAYRVSSHGQVVSLAFMGADRQRLLRPLNRAKYPEVHLRNGAHSCRLGLNRLVAQTFLPPPAHPQQAVVIPLDGNRFNLHAANLRWVSYGDVHDQNAWQYLHGCGTRPRRGKLTAADHERIAALAARGLSKQAIARQFGVSRPTISLLLAAGQPLCSHEVSCT